MNKGKRILSAVMALVIMLSMLTVLDLNAYATDTTSSDISNATDVTEATEATDATDAPQETVAPTVETSEGETEAPTVEQTDTPIIDTDKISKVQKIYKDSNYATIIKLRWDNVPDVDGYRVYYKNNDKHTDFVLLTTTTGTSITIKNLPHTTPFEFKISAYITSFGKTYVGEAATLKTATQPAVMKAPKLKKCSTSTKISWTRNSKADGYRIYRADASTNGKLKLYKTIKKNSTTTFEDKKVTKGRAYNYQVRSYRQMYKGSTYTSTGSTLKTVSGLCSSTVKSCTSQLRRISLQWSKNSVAQGYDIYCKADDQSSFKRLGSTKNTYYNTKRLRAGHTYTIRIKPYKLVGAKKTKVYGTYRTVTKKATSTAYGKKIGDTYIEISIKQQRMWYYIDDKLYVETPVVTGNVGAWSTPTGAHKIWQRSSPATLTGPTWSSYVNYWMAFTYGGCGIHDASWRSSSEFGGTTYMGNGSHGCVNTPYNAVKKIYGKAKVGTHVIIY